RTLIPSADLSAAGPEGFVVRSGTLAGAALWATDGNAPPPQNPNHGNLGAAYGTYALLEDLGFAFLHPLAPTVPKTLSFPRAPLNDIESPYWRIRGTHLHTIHPTELTELLNGWGHGDPNDVAGWTAMLPDWEHFLEWELANRQNRFEWVFLSATPWQSFANGVVRQGRFQQLVDRAHAWGLAAGADAAIALTQQHAFDLVQSPGTAQQDLAQIDSWEDWIFGAGFDFISTESGSTEFTHPPPSQMLDWMNEVATHAASAHGKPAYIKAHCSTGQTAPGYPDPNTGQPINFNFLPYYAVPQLGVMPHTVEDYSLTDPAPTYGNTDFQNMLTFLEEEAGAREDIWYPESAYWVSYDINVPLFLPVYAERRVADVRLLAADEKAGKMGRDAGAGSRMDGQMVFSSGWEWGYWLNDVVTARAAWNPQLAATNDANALATALAPVVRPFGPVAENVNALLVDTAEAERRLLILGQVNGAAPSSVVQLNGQAYLEGWTALDDLGALVAQAGLPGGQLTQPDRVGLVDLRNPFRSGPSYPQQIEPLLAAMEETFAQLAARAAALAPSIPPDAAPLFGDIHDGLRITYLRAKQMHGLYDFVNGSPLPPTAFRLSRLATARDALDQAQGIVAKREQQYRVDPQRIAGWRDNPTAYPYTYLWQVHSLYFWWRDEGKAVDGPFDPCYLNIDNVIDVGLGDGVLENVVQALNQVVPDGGLECLLAPSTEPTYPQNGLRSRP
ncbi:MAG TPA: hypothetical protein VH208_05880, partial [Myxococcaceae bacterium]|nr:hypothetical protein [Myxococcaceae bacterium]